MTRTLLSISLLVTLLSACSEAEEPGSASGVARDSSSVNEGVDVGGEGVASEASDGEAESPRSEGPLGCQGVEACLEEGMFCDIDTGECVPPVCEDEDARCATQDLLIVCDPAEGGPRVAPCAEEELCHEGACEPQLCDPSEGLVCEAGQAYQCDPSGTHLVGVQCPGGRTCIEGECRPILHNVMLLFDTSYSMNDCADGSQPDLDECCPAGCIEPWPVCETAQAPVTKLGASKAVFTNFLAGLGTQLTTRFALLTFPQEAIEFHSFCTSGYYSDRAYLPGDEGQHKSPTPPGGWFDQSREQVVRVPFASGWSEDNADTLLSWMDYVESPGENPELRSSGQTPLGRSMFYAGEYLRHYVVVDGKPCADDAECGSADYVCIEGTCQDPIKHCRKNILLVFTDGAESTNGRADDFYNPIVQARRMKFGLGCSSDADCLGGATCQESGVCQRFPIAVGPCSADGDCPGEAYCTEGLCELPGFMWPDNLGACSQSGNPCIVGEAGGCTGFLEQCQALDARYDDGASGANHLLARDGSAIEVTTHVINLDPETSESQLIAEHGGGLHFGADITSPDLLQGILQRMVDLKYGLTCVDPDEGR